MIREKSAGLIIYRVRPKEGVQYLLLYLRGNYFNFTKGHVNEGESESETALREAFEETGLTDLKLVPDFRQQTHFFFKEQWKENPELIKKDLVLYLAQAPHDGNVIIQNKETEHEIINGYAWMDFKSACKYLKFKNLKEILEEADYHINKGNG